MTEPLAALGRFFTSHHSLQMADSGAATDADAPPRPPLPRPEDYYAGRRSAAAAAAAAADEPSKPPTSVVLHFFTTRGFVTSLLGSFIPKILERRTFLPSLPVCFYGPLWIFTRFVTSSAVFLVFNPPRLSLQKIIPHIIFQTVFSVALETVFSAMALRFLIEFLFFSLSLVPGWNDATSASRRRARWGSA